LIEAFRHNTHSIDFHLIEKANGIEYLYAWLDEHPDVRPIGNNGLKRAKV